MSPPTTILITGANVGLGKDCARQMALKDSTKKIILGCRNEDKAKAAKQDLEDVTGKKDVFEILIMDVSDLDSVRKAVEELKEPIDGLVMNAGGGGGPEPETMTKAGVPVIVACNLLGHVLLVDLLLQQKKLTGSAVFSGSEAARGLKSFGLAKPTVETGSVDDYVGLVDGSFYKSLPSYEKDKFNAMYGYVKYMGALWMSHMARQQPEMRFVTMSPGATSGTDVMRDLPAFKRAIFSMAFSIFRLFGNSHTLETGAKRYVDALCDEETYKSGIFYASQNGSSGPVCDQVCFNEDFANETYQDNCNAAIHKFIK